MSKTADNLVYEVAGILGISVAGEALGSVEYTTIDGKIDGVLARIRSIVYIGDRDEIPDEVFDNIALMVSAFAGAKFSNQKPDLNYIRGLEQDLRYLVAPTATTEPLKTTYY